MFVKLKQVYCLSLSFCALLLLAACDPWKDDTTLIDGNGSKPLDEIVRQHSEVSTFASILKATGYDQFLQEKQALTVFAPTNEALKGLDLNNTEMLKEWIQNYIAYLSYYTDQNGEFGVEAIEMINEKSIPVTASSISGFGIVQSNLPGVNGVLHIIDSQIIARQSVWEYMQAQTGFAQSEFIASYNEEVMDMDKSVLLGVDENGQQVFDTVWVEQNTFLEAYPLDNERETFTVILLEEPALQALKTKYNKYLKRKEASETEKEVMKHISSDMILDKQEINEAGRFLSVNGYFVDLDPASISESYRASNGWVYKVSAADVKMYQNKIKEQLIEAEDYTYRYDGNTTDPLTDYWQVRYRSWASNGQDVILMGRSYHTVTYSYYDEVGDSIVAGSSEVSHFYPDRQNRYTKAPNAYLEYQPTLYSTDYQLSWLSYDDVASHYNVFGPDTFYLKIEQKLLISFPDEAPLVRTGEGVINNNFTVYSVMAAVSTAGTREETKLVRYRANSLRDDLFTLDQPYTSEDSFGTSDVLRSPTYGTATFFVANTTRGLNDRVGGLYLDYIRLTPLVNPND